MTMSGHEHKLEDGMSDRCDACDRFREAATCDAALMMDCWVNNDFRIVHNTIEQISRLSDRISLMAKKMERFIEGEYQYRYQASFDAFEKEVAFIKSNYPKNNPRKREVILEFLMASFFEEFRRLPIIFFDYAKSGSEQGKVPGNNDTLFFVMILGAAAVEARTIENARRAYAAPGDKTVRQEKAVGFGGDFSVTCSSIIKKWAGNVPEPATIFPLRGNTDLWSA